MAQEPQQAPQPPQPTLNQLAQDVYKAALDLRTAVEEYSAKKIRGLDPKELFPDKTDADVQLALKNRVKPAMQALRQARTALADRLRAGVDGTIA